MKELRSCYFLVCELRPLPTELLGLLNSLILRRNLMTAFWGRPSPQRIWRNPWPEPQGAGALVTRDKTRQNACRVLGHPQNASHY